MVKKSVTRLIIQKNRNFTKHGITWVKLNISQQFFDMGSFGGSKHEKQNEIVKCAILAD